MSQTMILSGLYSRQKAESLVNAAPSGSVMTIKPPARSSDQNSLLWALLSDVSRAKPEGRDMPPEHWKCLFMQTAGFAFTWEPGLDGQGVVPIGFKSSRLTKAEFSDLIECIREYGARHGVEWTDPETKEAA